MKPQARIYIFAVICVASAIIGAELLFTAEIGAEVAAEWQGLAWCVIIATIAEAMAVDFNVGGAAKQARSSLAFLPFLSALTIFSLPTAITVIFVVCLISQFALRRQTATIIRFFNVSQGVVAGYAAGSLHLALRNQFSDGLSDPTSAVGFAVLAATFFLVNMLLPTIALALMSGDRIIDRFRTVVGPNGANLWYDLLASPIALIPAILYEGSPVTGMVVVLLPLLLIQYSYLSKQQVIHRSKDLLSALVKAIETRDPYTSGHSLRVATMAKRIAMDMRLPMRKVNQIELAAILHDIGKIHPEFALVLSKPFDLTDEERALIQTHAARGADLLRELRSVQDDVALSVRHHHERFDGAGYPDGLKGMAIPLAARIIMLCDSVDAMLSDRPYRKALSIEVVRAELERCKGSQFDPAIVDVVLAAGSLEKALELIHADLPAVTMEIVAWS